MAYSQKVTILVCIKHDRRQQTMSDTHGLFLNSVPKMFAKNGSNQGRPYIIK